MLLIISPSKTMKTSLIDEEMDVVFKDKSAYIIEQLKKLNQDELKKIYKCNDKIAKENYLNFQNFKTLKAGNAIEMFSGLVFKNIDYENLDISSQNYLNNHLYILSALYGVIKATSKIKPYRLDYENKILIDNLSLYKYWNSDIYDYLKTQDQTIINLASKEYFDSISPYIDKEADVIDIEFLILKNGKYLSQSTLAKTARGLFVNFMANNKIDNLEDLKNFSLGNFEFNEELSSKNKFVFIKK